MSRWISCVRPPTLPADASRVVRVEVARGSMPYSAVTQPLPVEREVVYGEGTIEQAKRIIEAQVAPPQPPLVSAIPLGTKLKAVFVTPKGDAYVDLSTEVRSNHPGGTTNEILTAYTLVSALTLNLPAITGVQILIDGKEVDTLAGHLDLRRPLEQDGQWISQ